MTIIMGVMNVLMIFVYAQLFVLSVENGYFIGRTRQSVTVEKNFEVYSVNKVLYFLYLNNTEGAVDAIGAKNTNMITDI